MRIISSLKIQSRVIRALFIREMISHFGRNNIGFLWMFIEPMMFSIGVAVLWTLIHHDRGSIPVAGFALTGYSALVAWRHCVGKTSVAVKANQGLLYHKNVTVLDLAINRVLFEFLAVTFSFFFLTLLFYVLNLSPLPENFLKALSAWALLGWFFGCAGFIALYFDHSSDIFGKIWHVMLYLTIPFTGALVMTDWLPKEAQRILLFSPMVHGVEMLREGFFGEKINALYSLRYLISFNIISSFIALALISKVKRTLSSEH